MSPKKSEKTTPMRMRLSAAVSFAALLVAVPALAQEQANPLPPTSQPPPAAEPPAKVATEPPVGEDRNALAGYHGGLFYLRDRDDNFRLYIQGRAQIDMYNYFGPGVADTGLKSTVFLRRIRPELSGEFLKDFYWQLSGDWGQTGLDNPKGTNESQASAPGTAPTATSGKYAAAQTASVKAGPTDVFLGYRADSLFQIQFGQFDAPFTMENRTSDKYIPFMERSLAVRALGIPTNKEVGMMFWGEAKDRLFFWSAGVFDGDGQNRVSPDNRPDVMGRVFVHPLNTMPGAIKDLQIGASARYGRRDPNYVNYDYNALTTQGSYAFWSPTYADSYGRTIHIMPSNEQMAFAGELRVPIEMFDLTSEFVYVKNDTREAVEGFQTTNTERAGDIHGYSYYVQLGYWIGKRDVNGLPGYENPPHVDLGKADPPSPPMGVQLLAKWEQLHLTYSGASRVGTPEAKGGADGDIKVNAVSLGGNVWLTRHVRLTANYVFDMFPDSAPIASKKDPAGSPAQTSSQRALAPGNTLGVNVNPDARFNAHVLHELLFRAAVAF